MPTRLPTVLLTKNPALSRNPQEIFQYLFGAHECLNIKKKEARSVGVGFLGGGSEPPPHQL